jgi:hypothetical protein
MAIDLESISSREELIKILRPTGIGIEIGVREGEYSSFILNNCPDLKLYLLDCWDQQDPLIYNDLINHNNSVHAENLKKTIINILPHFKKVRIIKGYTNEFVDLFPNNFFDFIYIDANHSYEAVKNDLIKWFPKLKNNGLFSGHDYLDGKDGIYQTEFGVKSAVDQFATKNNLKIYHTKDNHPWKTWFTFKV